MGEGSRDVDVVAIGILRHFTLFKSMAEGVVEKRLEMNPVRLNPWGCVHELANQDSIGPADHGSMPIQAAAAGTTVTARGAHRRRQSLHTTLCKLRLSSWHVHAAASGGDCAVLLVEMPAIMEDSTIEAYIMVLVL